MQVSAVKSASRRSQQARTDPVRGSVRKKKDGGAKAGSKPAEPGGVGLHLLGSLLRPLPLFEVAMLRGDSGRDSDDAAMLKMIDTEAKQLQAIEDLYAIVKAQSKYAAMKQPDWKGNTEPMVVLYWLLKKLGPLAEGNSWTVDTYKEADKTRYCFVIYKPYNSQVVKAREEHFALDFLPMLKDRDLPMHDLIIDIVALVSRENNVPLWDEDGDYSENLKDLMEVPTGGYTVYTLEKQHEVYTTGPAGQYLRMIKERRQVVTEADIYDQLRKYDASSQRKNYFTWWIKSGLAVAKGKGDIKNNTYVADHLPGPIITPYQLYKFIWSTHDSDVIHIRTRKRFNKWPRQLPIMFSVTKPGEIVKPMFEDRHPKLLYDFMSNAVTIHVWRYRDYYYKKAFESKEPPSVRLLEQIELAEIHNETR